MPVFVALPLGVTFGASFAWASRRELRRAAAHEPTTRALSVATLFGMFVFAPVCGYFLAFEPDWCLAYLLDTSSASAALVPALLMLELASVPVGYLLAARVVKTSEEASVLRVLAISLVVSLAALMLGLRRFAVQGSYTQFHGDFGTQPLAGSSLGYAILLLGFWLAAGLAFALWSLRRLD